MICSVFPHFLLLQKSRTCNISSFWMYWMYPFPPSTNPCGCAFCQHPLLNMCSQKYQKDIRRNGVKLVIYRNSSTCCKYFDILWFHTCALCIVFLLCVYFEKVHIVFSILLMIWYPCVEANMISFDQQRETFWCQRQFVFGKEKLISHKEMQEEEKIWLVNEFKFVSCIEEIGLNQNRNECISQSWQA